MTEASVHRISSPEWKRKAVHAGMGLFALTLRWLDWKAAALLALAALLFNVFVMPRIGRGIYRDGEGKWDTGIVAYAAMVLLLLLLFPNNLPVVAAVWGMMAFGDPAAAIVGKTVGGPRLPWNPEKRWTGLMANAGVGSVAATLLFLFVSAEKPLEGMFGPGVVFVSVGLAALAFAFLESVRSGLDDNLVAPLPSALVLIALLAVVTIWTDRVLWEYADASFFGRYVLPSFAVNAAVSFLAWRVRLVSGSGAVTGAVVGFSILAFGGWGAYAVLWTFFGIGTLATRLGYRFKRLRGVAERNEGRRGAAHVIANCAVPTVLVLMLAPLSAAMVFAPNPPPFFLCFSSAFGAALADTLGTEIGTIFGRNPVSPLSFRRLALGTPGAVSWQGSLAGLAGACLIGLVAILTGIVAPSLFWVVAVSGALGSLAESLVNDLGRVAGFRLDHDFANGLNTFVGAMAAAGIYLVLVPVLVRGLD